MAQFDVVIVGAGHGAAQLAAALRQVKFQGSVAVIGDEPYLPYERPPLSKAYLSGDKTFEEILIRPAQFWTDQNVSFLLGSPVVGITPSTKTLTLGSGEEHQYGHLVWAAGGEPRRLSCQGYDLDGVHTVRRRSEVDAIMAELPDVSCAVVVGGGYIGLEAAAVLRKLGKEVVLIEALDRVMARVAGEPLSRFIEGAHAKRGVEVRLGVGVESLSGEGGKVRAVRLADGTEIAADMVIVGIGITPAVEPLTTAGAVGGNGVDVDEACRTSLPDVFAIGDCARHQNPYADNAWIRLESVQNAADQAKVVAKILAGREASYNSMPWFWSDQFDLELKTIGLNVGFDETVLRGDPDTEQFSLVYLKNDRVIALDCVNAGVDFAQGRRLIMTGANPDRAKLADPSVSLLDLA